MNNVSNAISLNWHVFKSFFNLFSVWLCLRPLDASRHVWKAFLFQIFSENLNTPVLKNFGQVSPTCSVVYSTGEHGPLKLSKRLKRQRLFRDILAEDREKVVYSVLVKSNSKNYKCTSFFQLFTPFFVSLVSLLDSVIIYLNIKGLF